MVKNLAVNAGDTRQVGSIPGLGSSPREENGSPLQYSCLKNPMDRGAWWVKVCGVTESDTTEITHVHTHTHTPIDTYIHTTHMHSSIHHLSSPLSIYPCIRTFSYPCIHACILLCIHSSTYANIHNIYTSIHSNSSIRSPFTL